MSERYSRLFTLPENLYTVGSPVIIAAGTLLKDTQTGNIVAQLKLQSISNKAIKAVKVKLDLFDTAEKPLGESVVHDYLDLNVARDVEFGQKNPVMVPNVKARSYKASVAEVVFVDRSVWTEADGNWEPLSKPSRLAFADYELQKQFEIKFGGGSMYEAKAEKDLWHCTCGALNRDGEMCHICHNTLLALQTLDISALEKEKDARLAEEARVAAERARKVAEEQAVKEAAAKKVKKKTEKFLKIAIPAVCALVAIVLLLTKVVIPNNKYKDAVALLDAGQYSEAITAFSELGDYKDAPQMVIESEDRKMQYELETAYQEAVSLLETGSDIEAYEVFSKLNGYKDSKEKANIIYSEHEDEKIKFAKVGDYVSFGAYEQDNITLNGKEAIEWLVLEVKDRKALVISKYALDYIEYEPTAKKYSTVTWETCALRKWLNYDFVDAAFTDYERAAILTVTISAEKNPNYNTNPGNATKDQVFLLSIAEANELFDSDSARQCVATEYAVANGARENDETGNCQWWLRSPGSESHFTVCIYHNGNIGYYGTPAFHKESVRPALWIDLSAL